MKRIDHIVREATYKGMFYVAYHNGDFPVYTTPHRHNFYEILWLTRATGIQDVDGKQFPLSSNDLFLISEGQVHCIHDSGSVSGYLLCFKEDFWHYAPTSVKNFQTSLFNNLLINSYFHLDQTDADEITGLLESMLHEFQKDDYASKTELLAAYMKILLIKIDSFRQAETLKTKVSSQEYHVFEKVIQLIEESYAADHEVSSYAGKLNVPPRKLTSICQLVCGRGAKELIDRRIISEAKRMLQFSDLSVKEIAGALNFSDQYQFSKFFKKHTMTSPVAFRQEFAEIDI